jgi:hypothetical protein
MEPLSGNAEHISARTAAVISTNTIVIRYEDLKDGEMLDSFSDINFTISLPGHQRSIPERRKIYSNSALIHDLLHANIEHT